MSELPPGPSSAVISTYKVGAHPFEFYRDCARDYGDPFTVRALNGTVVCTGDPEGAREVFTGDPDTFSPFGMEAAEPVIGPHSIFLLSGPAHKEERKLLAAPFHGRRMKAYYQAMQRAAVRAIERWEPGQPLVMQAELQSIAMDVILRAVFGAEEGEDLEGFEVAVRDTVDQLHPAVVFFRFLQHEFGGVGPWAKFRRAYDHLEGMIRDKIAQRRATDARGEDILSLLVEARYEDGSPMSDDQIVGEMVTLMVAGHETTGVSMAWTFDHLHRDPALLERLRGELGQGLAPQELVEVPLLEATILETLRLHPVLSDVLRQLEAPFELRGHKLPAGVAVAVIPWLIHRRPEIFPEPERFNPDRFVDQRYSPYEYAPFGGAPRRCIGSAFAMSEMRIVLGTILSRCRFRLAEQEPPETKRLNLIMGTDDGVPLVYEGPL